MTNPAASSTFTPGDLVVVSKPGSSHFGWTAKVLSVTSTGSVRVSLGGSLVRTYYPQHVAHRP